VDDNIANAGFRQALRTLPAAARVVLSKKFNDGQDLSGGQWQRMGIARGIYRDAAVLIADEPAAALDARAEARVFAGLQHAGTGGHGPAHHRAGDPPARERGRAPTAFWYWTRECSSSRARTRN
jgi:hypothetical protein